MPLNNTVTYIIAFLLSFILTIAFEKKLIPRLSAIAKQPIYEEGPSWHLKKSGTPTMGGLAFLFATIISLTTVLALFSEKFTDMQILSITLSLIYAILNSLIGVFDDLTKLKRKKNAGLTPREKLIMQTIAAASYLTARGFFLNDDTAITFASLEIDLGLFYYPLSLIFLLGLVNSTNLTDGIDGLASSVAFAIGVGAFYLTANINAEGAIISLSLIGIALGFLLFNIHPAKIFMGDTGSLFIGAFIATMAFTLDNQLIILIIAGVYAFEGFSVALQVIFYKLTKRRIFRMAPFHHHLERYGWDENKICVSAIFATLILSIPAYILYTSI